MKPIKQIFCEFTELVHSKICGEEFNECVVSDMTTEFDGISMDLTEDDIREQALDIVAKKVDQLTESKKFNFYNDSFENLAKGALRDGLINRKIDVTDEILQQEYEKNKYYFVSSFIRCAVELDDGNSIMDTEYPFDAVELNYLRMFNGLQLFLPKNERCYFINKDGNVELTEETLKYIELEKQKRDKESKEQNTSN